ncbi:MAG TPA: TetR/AcrR family transcriptional regulator [Sphingomonas sp.]|jgi:AcrR family transcriptional regulator|uniref:TetR/AcrR family transcriptional regulator n=1 Tax=Sphingomonas sp. TaxID=28214 RepID=UPI002ED7C3E8
MKMPRICDEPEIGRRERRAGAMVAAAKDLFLERGYDAVSLTQIVQRSGGSLSTLYDLFGSKLGLLSAVVNAERNDDIGRLRIILSRDEPPAAILRAAAGHLLDMMADPTLVGLIRLVMGEVLTSPEFAARIYADTHKPLIDEFSALFAQWNAEGRAQMPEPQISAHMFTALFFHAPQMRVLFSDMRAPEVCERQQMLGRAIDMFLAGASIAPD